MYRSLILSLFVFALAGQTPAQKKDAGAAPPQPTPTAQTPPAPEPVIMTVRETAGAPPANGSLFAADAPGLCLVNDFKARRVGDLLFVVVEETSSATVTSSAKRARDSGTLGGLTDLVGALPINGAGTAGAVIGSLGQRKFEGKGSTDRTSTVRARIAARVVEVLPNGDLRIAAEKQVKINKETEKLLLSGIVRQRDIATDNSVLSVVVGDLKLELNGKGVASADNSPGWLFRLFERISPF